MSAGGVLLSSQSLYLTEKKNCSLLHERSNAAIEPERKKARENVPPRMTLISIRNPTSPEKGYKKKK